MRCQARATCGTLDLPLANRGPIPGGRLAQDSDRFGPSKSGAYSAASQPVPACARTRRDSAMAWGWCVPCVDVGAGRPWPLGRPVPRARAARARGCAWLRASGPPPSSAIPGGCVLHWPAPTKKGTVRRGEPPPRGAHARGSSATPDACRWRLRGVTVGVLPKRTVFWWIARSTPPTRRQARAWRR